MDEKKYRIPLRAPLHKDDTQNQTFGCRANDPSICKNCYVEGICAFTSTDHICKAPSAKWKKYYNMLREGKD